MSLVRVDYTTVRDITATGGATFILGPTSTESGATGWGVAADYVYFRDINATGATKIVASSNSVNASGNTGILWLFDTSLTATQNTSVVAQRTVPRPATATQAQSSTATKVRTVARIIPAVQSLTLTLTKSIGKRVTGTQVLVPSVRRTIGKTLNYTQLQVSSLRRSILSISTAIQNILVAVRTRGNIFGGTASVTVVTDKHPVTSTSRGVTSVVNTDGASGSRVFVGKTAPTTIGVVPQVGDIWITDPFNGATSQRPAASIGIGAKWFDTTLDKPIWSNGTVWKDASGTLV